MMTLLITSTTQATEETNRKIQWKKATGGVPGITGTAFCLSKQDALGVGTKLLRGKESTLLYKSHAIEWKFREKRETRWRWKAGTGTGGGILALASVPFLVSANATLNKIGLGLALGGIPLLAISIAI